MNLFIFDISETKNKIMKRIFILLSISLIPVLNLFSQNLNESLLLHYPFNGNANNSLSSEYNLPGNGPELTSDRFANIESAYLFNGQSGFEIELAKVNNQSLAQSISLWFKTDNNTALTYSQLIFGYVGHNKSRFVIAINQGALSVEYGVGNLGSEYLKLFTTELYNDNNWHHVVLTSEGDYQNGILYVDGIKKLDFTTGLNINNQDLSIKVGGDDIKNYFTGCIDDIRVYQKTLTETEVNFLKYEYPCLNTITQNENITTTETLIINLPIPLTAENKSKTSISIYPNPAKDFIIIDIDDYSTITDYTIIISDILGRNKFQTQINQSEFQIDISNFDKGNYLVNIHDNKTNIIETRKITIQ